MGNIKVIRSEENKKYGIINKSALYDLLRADGSIVINKNLMRAIGVNEAIIYCELLSRDSYFEIRNEITDDGYFFNTIEDLELGTCLSEYQQRKAIKRLSSLNLLETQLRGIPAKRYFKMTDNAELISEYIAKGKEIQQFRRNSRTCNEATKELEPKKLKTNNTNVTNTNITNTKEKDNGTLSNDKDSTSSYHNQDVVDAMRTYMNDLYKQKTGKKHPFLKSDQYRNVYNSISSFADENSLDYDDIAGVMVAYFNNNTLQTDYNINHFATEGIMMNRLYEIS